MRSITRHRRRTPEEFLGGPRAARIGRRCEPGAMYLAKVCLIHSHCTIDKFGQKYMMACCTDRSHQIAQAASVISISVSTCMPSP